MPNNKLNRVCIYLLMKVISSTENMKNILLLYDTDVQKTIWYGRLKKMAELKKEKFIINHRHILKVDNAKQ